MGPINLAPTSFCAAAVRQQAEILMQRTSLSSGVTAVVPLSVAAAAFRSLQDGVRAADAGSRLIRIRFNFALEKLFEELLGSFFEESGPAEAARYFYLVISDADDAGNQAVAAGKVGDLVRYARRFADRADSGRLEQLAGWSSRLTGSTLSSEALAGAYLLDAWLSLQDHQPGPCANFIEEGLRHLRVNEDEVLHFEEKAGQLHFHAGIALLTNMKASMGEIQRAALHLRDAWAHWDRAEIDTRPARKFLSYAYRRLAHEHTQGNDALRTHFENQALQATLMLPPQLPQARVVRKTPQRAGWISRLWK